MIKVNEIIAWSDAERCEYVELGHAQLEASVRNLRRAIEFYTRVFGFSVDATYFCDGSAVMRGTARADFVLREQGYGGRERVRSQGRWGFVVTNLDRAREAVWELGVAVARDSGAPDHIYQWSDRRSLYVRDPDANEIELVEVWSYARDLRALVQLAGSDIPVHGAALPGRDNHPLSPME